MSMQNGKIIDQKAYLKKYLSGDKEKKKKKKEKKHKKTAKVKIIDDDAYEDDGMEMDEDLLLGGEDAPQIVGEYIEDNPDAVRSKWRNIAVKDEVKEEDNKEEASAVRIKQEPADQQDEEERWGRKATAVKTTKERSAQSPLAIKIKQEKRSTSRDLSPKRDFSAARRKRSPDQSPPRRKRVADQSPPRRRRGSPDQSPPRRKRDEDQSPPRRKRVNSDQSPPRGGRKSSPDQSPPRRRRDSDQSPPRRRRSHNSNQSPPRKGRRSSADQSPPRKGRRSSPDQSPPRRRRDVDQSPDQRRKDSDQSPPRKRDLSAPRRRRNSDQSPPRRRRSASRERRPRIKEESPPGRRKSRWAKASPSPSPPPTHEPKASKTLDGKSAGLQDAQSLKKESDERRRREHNLFEQMSSEVSGRYAEIQMRSTGRRGRRAREAAEEDPAERRRKEEHEKKKKDLYDRWGKGLKQIEDLKVRHEEMAHEASKPVARYANDEDLDRHLREQEHADDPMLEYMRQKRKKQDKLDNKPVMPKYEGSFPENRYGIRPGYRWDGVDRSNGYEQRWFDKQNERKAMQDEAYKYSVEDM
ncbi:GL12707 [Drosophila persimilis]|uniref:BUD13 homolog n=1 Tax=Drosophila persimilis TaxID=7234 RepID=B4GM40_DROPE|nr:BUD13 homolog [Drosophila persimilis]EDW38614.1 GL12707 [Drosophila persimilis]